MPKHRRRRAELLAELQRSSDRLRGDMERVHELAQLLGGRLERLEAQSLPLADGMKALEHEFVALATRVEAQQASLEVLVHQLPQSSSRDATRFLGGSIDTPERNAAVARGPLTVRGWALTYPSPVARVEILLDRRVRALAELGFARDDVPEVHAVPASHVSGFEYTVDLRGLDLSGDQLHLQATAVAADGTRGSLPPVTARIASELASTEVDRELASRHQADFAQRLSSRISTKRDRTSIRLLAFVHSLQFGGAELRLLELLKTLSQSERFGCRLVAIQDGPLRARFESLGIPVHVTMGQGVGEVTLYEQRMTELGAWATLYDFNVVLATTLVSFPAVDLALRLQLPVVWSMHETLPVSIFIDSAYPWEAPVHPYLRERVEYLLGAATAIVVPAEAARQQYARHGDSNRFITLPGGIDMEPIKRRRMHAAPLATRERFNIPDDSYVLLCVAILQPRKAQTVLAVAMEQLLHEHPNLLCVLVGDRGGPYSAALHRFVGEAGLDEKVWIIPTSSEVHAWLEVADALVCPSYDETLPGVILEAMAFEVPVLATPVGGIADLIDDGVTGLLCVPRDAEALINGIRRLLELSGDDRKRITDAALERVRQRHNIADRADAIGRVLHALVSDPALPAEAIQQVAEGSASMSSQPDGATSA